MSGLNAATKLVGDVVQLVNEGINRHLAVAGGDLDKPGFFLGEEPRGYEGFQDWTAVGAGEGSDVLRSRGRVLPAADAGLADAGSSSDLGRAGRTGDTLNVLPPRHAHQLMRVRFPFSISTLPITALSQSVNTRLRACAHAHYSGRISSSMKARHHDSKGGHVNATLRLRHDELAKHRAGAALHTEQSLADAMGADRGTVNRVLRGKAKPGVDFAASLVTALPNVSFTDVWEIIPTDSGESK